MFSIDKTCSTPFHLLNADLLDCLGGSAELIRIFNRLGLCVSLDTLSRHIQTTISTVQKDSLLQGLDPSNITVFTVDNIDYLHSLRQSVLWKSKAELSWHNHTGGADQTVDTSSWPETLPRSSLSRNGRYEVTNSQEGAWQDRDRIQ